MLTGDISMTDGTAIIAGYDIRTHLQEVFWLTTVSKDIALDTNCSIVSITGIMIYMYISLLCTGPAACWILPTGQFHSCENVCGSFVNRNVCSSWGKPE